jgi:hypothetical protein
MWALLLAAGGGAYVALKPEGGKKAKAKPKAAPRMETGTKSVADKSEWLKGTAWSAAKKDKAAKGTKAPQAAAKPAAKAAKK